MESSVMSTRTVKKSIVFFLLCLAGTGFIPLHTHANTQGGDVLEPSLPLSETMMGQDKQEFEYVLEGRPDPFVPFISKKAATPKLDPNEIIDEDVELTGMRQFEPGQLRLVAILETPRKKIAMVEDVTGRGYTIDEGTPIGRHGVVSQITRGQVIITETAHTRAGKEIKNTIVMRLNKEGEQ
jgi:type IV pilus assembly protein PilP